MRATTITCLLAGCAYQPGSFAHVTGDPSGRDDGPWAGRHTTVGCVDVAIVRRVDLPVGPALGYRFGNRCDHLTIIDLAAATVIGRDADGTERALAPYDPEGVVHPGLLDVRGVGEEALAYSADRAQAQICVDVAALAHASPAPWLCFASASPAVATRRAP
jgi:hypothetical protein